METTIEYSGYQVRLAYSSKGSLRVADIYEDEVVIWNASEQEKLDTFEHRGRTRAARFSDDGQQFAIASARDFHVWRAGTEKVASLSGHLSLANSVVFSQNDRTLMSGHGEGSGIVFWDVEQKWVQRTYRADIELHNAKRFTTMSPSEEFLATSFLKTIEIWSVTSGTRLAEFTEPGGLLLRRFRRQESTLSVQQEKVSFMYGMFNVGRSCAH